MHQRRAVLPAAAVLLLTGCSAQEAPVQQAAPVTTTTGTSAPPQASPSSAVTPSPMPTSSPVPSPLSPPPPPPPSRAAEPEPEPEPEAPFPADRSRDTATHDGERLSVVDLRFGRHVGYDRVVVELAGDGRPGWFAQYREVPRHQGRGNRVDIDGQTVLELSVTGVRYPNERGAEEYQGPRGMRPRDAGVVSEVLRGSVYEGHQQVFIGLDAKEQPFRVFRIPDPPRVVVDIQHPR